MGAGEGEIVMVPTPSGVRLAACVSGPDDGRPVIVLHGVMQTNDTVLKGTALEDAGYRVIAYDARGHGASAAPVDQDDYGYGRLVEDLVAVMDEFGASPAVLVGVSMGALTAMRLACEQPERVGGLVAITPAYDPFEKQNCMTHAELVAAALRTGDVDALLETSPVQMANDRQGKALVAFARRTARRTVEAHRDLDATAAALLGILRATPLDSLEPLASIDVPTVVVGSHDEFDLNHPLRLAKMYAEAVPGARFVCEHEGELPLAWKGRDIAQLAREVADLAFDARSERLARSAR